MKWEDVQGEQENLKKKENIFLRLLFLFFLTM